MIKTLEPRYIIVIICTIALFLDRLDLTIVNIALPAIAQHFHVLVTETEWVNTSFLLALSLSIPISAWLSERIGHKQVFISAIGLFTLTSLLCAFSPNLLFLDSMRFLQGLASGLFVPVGMSMVFRSFPPKEYTNIMSYIFIPSLVAPALAPMVGGIMVEYFNWRWIFLFAVPVGTSIMVSAYYLLQELPFSDAAHAPFDTQGFILSSLTLFLIFHVLACMGKQPLTWILYTELLCATLLGYWFMQHEQGCKNPLLDIHLFRNKLFAQANWIQILFQIGHFGAIFLVAIYLQMSVGYSAILAGTTMGMQAFGAMCSSRISVFLYEKYSNKIPLCIGLIGVCLISPLILCLNRTMPMSYGFGILFVRGLLSGLCGAPIQALSVVGFSHSRINQATALFNISRQLAISLGIALSALLLRISFNYYGANALNWQNKAIFYPAFALISCATLLGAYIASRIEEEKPLSPQHKDPVPLD